MNLSQFCSKIIYLSFHALFFLVPLILTPANFELFEYNKTMSVYVLTVVILGTWLIKMINDGQFYLKRTPLDLPLLLFIVSQVLSTIFSLDRHTSIFGYYSRFHGGLLSTISYILLYYALVSNFQFKKLEIGNSSVISLLKTALFSAFLVAVYGILEHPNPLFRNPDGSWRGIDAGFWVQDVQLRVFSTIGQPNWLAAYLSMLIPVAIAFMLIEKSRSKKTIYCLLSIVFYWCLLFTNSRSGAVGFFVALMVFLSLLGLTSLKSKSQVRVSNLKKRLAKNNLPRTDLAFLGITLVTFGILTLVSGKFLLGRFGEILTLPKKGVEEKTSPLPQPLSKSSPTLPPSPIISQPTIFIPQGETEKIRNIVWKGAIEIFKHFPILGSGVETFAYSYYLFRPVEHNLTTEWDFLYNKAHNEYLNFLATTGIVGFSSYIFLILAFIYWALIKLLSKLYTLNPIPYTLILALLSSYLAYLVQNIFSFSVVPIALFFFLFPAIAFVLAGKFSILPAKGGSPPRADGPLACASGGNFQFSIFKRLIMRYLLCALVAIASIFSLLTLARMWLADTAFAQAYKLAEAGYLQSSYLFAKEAISKNPNEPMYHDQLALDAAVLATYSKEASTSAILAYEALTASNQALTISPLNVNFWKTAVKVFYELGSLNEDYFQKALESIKTAIKLSPTDPKLPYNEGLIYLRIGKQVEAAESFKRSIELKPNFRDPRFALGVLYHQQAVKNDKIVDDHLLDQAVFQMEYILANIDSGDVEVQEKLRAWTTQ